MKKLAVLISNAGKGSNLQAIIDAIINKKLKAIISIVVSSSPDAFGLERAKKNNIPALIINKNDDLEKILKTYQIDLIILAGWKRIIPKSLIDSLTAISSYIVTVKNPDGTVGLWNRGKLTDDAIQNFLDNKSTYAGSTVHLLSNEFDFGPVLNHCFEKIIPGDTVDSLYTRLKKKENEIYVQSLINLCNK